MAASNRKKHPGRVETAVQILNRAGTEPAAPAKQATVTPAVRLFRDIRRLSSKVPEQTWRQAPSDGSHNHDHYLYGTPRK